jgi:1-acyl-sn-glycerol-3-phosphate acyltransferase
MKDSKTERQKNRKNRKAYVLQNTYSQISTASGFIKEKSLVGFPEGTLKRMEMPRFMKASTERQIEGET